MENIHQEPNPKEQFNTPLTHLDSQSPEDKDIIDNLELIRAEVRNKYPTPMSVVDAYRKGLVDYAWLSSGFNAEEIVEILVECDKRNLADKENKYVVS